MDERNDSQPPAKKVKAPSRPILPKSSRVSKQSTLKKATSKTKSPAKSKKSRASSPQVPESERRRSGRASNRKSAIYTERDSDDDDEEMLEGVAKWDYGDAEEPEESGSEEEQEDEGTEEVMEAMDEDGEEEEEEVGNEPSDKAAETEADVDEEEETLPVPTNGRRSSRAAAKAQPPSQTATKQKASALPTRGKAEPAKGVTRSRRAKGGYDSDG